MADIKVVGLTKYFGETLGVADIDLTVSDGELFALAGPTGSGKSALVRLLAGLEEPTEGEIWIGARLVSRLPAKDRRVAVLFQNYALTPNATVFDNIAIPLHLQQVPSDEARQRVEIIAAMLGISSLLERVTAGLSTGDSYLVALARAFVSAPQILLMDGPLGNLEPEARPPALEQLSQWQRKLGITTIYTAQDHAEAMQIATRMAVLSAGRIQQIGSPAELYDQPANRFVATFIGRPPMNLLEATVIAQADKIYLDIGPVNLAVPPPAARNLAAYEGQPVVVGVRSEDIFDKRAAHPKPTISHSSVPVQVEKVTPLGDRHLLLLNTGQDMFTALASPSALPPVGTRIEVVFDLARIHFFDGDTGRRIAQADSHGPAGTSGYANGGPI